MNGTVLSQWQFALTTVYHFFFVPLTIGLSVMVAIMESLRQAETGQRLVTLYDDLMGKVLTSFSQGGNS